MMAAKNIQLTHEEFWARVFVEARILESGITFDQFLTNPDYYLSSIGQETAPECIKNGFLPLLPKQAAVAKRLRDQGF